MSNEVTGDAVAGRALTDYYYSVQNPDAVPVQDRAG